MEFVDDLPNSTRGRFGRRAAWRSALEANPGKWAVMPITQPPSRPSEREGYEFAVRGGQLYARYVGTDPKGATK